MAHALHALSAMKAGLNATAIVLILGGTNATQAQDYPSRPVRVIVGLAAGGPGDVLTRIVVEGMGTALGQRFFVENRPGAGSNIAFKAAAAANADGYTLLAASTSLTINPHIYDSAGYDPVRDFAPISRMAQFPLVMIANANFPASNLEELVATARANPGKFNYGSSGNGSTPHLAGVLFNQLAKTNITHVPYQSIPALLTDMLAGRINIAFVTPSAAVSFVNDQRLKAFATLGAKRSIAMPETPSTSEVGWPTLDIVTWYGLLAPAGTPDSVLERLHAAVSVTLRDPAVHKKLVESGAELKLDESPAAFKTFVERDVGSWGEITRSIGAKSN